MRTPILIVSFATVVFGSVSALAVSWSETPVGQHQTTADAALSQTTSDGLSNLNAESKFDWLASTMQEALADGDSNSTDLSAPECIPGTVSTKTVTATTFVIVDGLAHSISEVPQIASATKEYATATDSVAVTIETSAIEDPVNQSTQDYNEKPLRENMHPTEKCMHRCSRRNDWWRPCKSVSHIKKQFRECAQRYTNKANECCLAECNHRCYDTSDFAEFWK